jgi:hypothetical protein
MSLYEWILVCLKMAKDTYPDDPDLGLESFLGQTACEFASLTTYKSLKEFEKRREYFAQALYQLLTIVPIGKSDLTIRMVNRGYLATYMSVDATSWDFNGMCPEQEGHYSQIDWGIEYTDWGEWLAMNISDDFFNINWTTALAHVMWEMTWCGHDYTEWHHPEWFDKEHI